MMTGRRQPVETARSPAPRWMLALAAGLVVAAGLWGALAGRGSPGTSADVAPVGAVVAIPGGGLRVDRVTPLVVQHAMAGTDPDPVPAGSRRILVEFTVAAAPDHPVRYRATDFVVTGSGMRPVGTLRHHLGTGVVPAGSAASGLLTFEVPTRATGLLVRFRGASRPISVEETQAAVHVHGHDG